ncbi:MAG: aspartate aminotransferase family protein [Planctomycetes bacterium]|nr:aspartate aminotransferase family protein [Planctomycetota bacterium]
MLEEEDAYQLPTYAKHPFALVRGEGVRVLDSEGRRYLDLYGGHAVASTGHSHPRVVRAIAEQAARLLFYSNVCYNDARARACRRLSAASPIRGTRVFLCNSGTEANEAALRLARRRTGREVVVAMDGGFHGRTLGSLAVTGLESYTRDVRPMPGGTRRVPFGDLAAARRALDVQVAAIILEPVQSMAGCRIAGPEYYRGLRSLCDEVGAFLIYDEVQTGAGRSGAFSAAVPLGTIPDVITLAKGVASGFPAGATLVAPAVAEAATQGVLGSTFGGGPVACAAIEATLDVLEGEGIYERVRRVGHHLRRTLATVGAVREVRGLGLLLGVVLDREARPVARALLERGVIAGTSSAPDTLRLLPPLTLCESDADEFVEALRGVVD